MQDKSKKKKWYKHPVIIVLFGIPIGLVALTTMAAIIYGIASYDGSTENIDNGESTQVTTPTQTQASQKRAKYQVKVTGNEYADPTVRRVTFTVTNIGDAEANPTCNVDVFNEAKTYKGFDYVTWNTPLKPGEFKYYSELVIVTNEGAAYATKAEVKCS